MFVYQDEVRVADSEGVKLGKHYYRHVKFDLHHIYPIQQSHVSFWNGQQNLRLFACVVCVCVCLQRKRAYEHVW